MRMEQVEIRTCLDLRQLAYVFIMIDVVQSTIRLKIASALRTSAERMERKY